VITLPTELESLRLADIEIFEQREIEVRQARGGNDIAPGTSVVSDRDLEGRGIEPALQTALIGWQIPVSQPVRPRIAARAAIRDRFCGLYRVNRHAGLPDQTSIRLPTAQKLRGQAAFSAEEGQLVKRRAGHAMPYIGLGETLFRFGVKRIAE